MRPVFLNLLLMCLFLFAVDAYVFKGVFLISKGLSSQWRWAVHGLYWLVSIILIFQIVNIFSSGEDYRVQKPEAFLWWSGVFFTIFIAKFFFLVFHLIGDVGHLLKWIGYKLADLNKAKEFRGESISRSTFITQIGAGASLLVLGLYSYGMTKGKFAFRVLKEKLRFDNVPDSFVGTRIVHISDLHLGSFVNQFEKIEEAVQMINDLEPDYIFFTGDMVNVHADEAEPWIPVFKKLKAKEGMYSIFGNHDYCDYGNYTDDEKIKSINRLKEIHAEMGFRLLEDEHMKLEKNGESIYLLGTHNWGKGFHQIGVLENAMKDLPEEPFSVLLSHDPTQWEEKIMDQLPVDLTLSGHTHGMQMGLEIPALNIKFSPIRLRYKRWAGLYHSKSREQRIYINRGFGVLGFPGRVGMPPEITLLELANNKDLA